MPATFEPRPDGWFTEVHGQDGSAFSLAVTETLLDRQTDYQHLRILQTKTFGKLMVLDGCVMLTGRDNFLYHEMLAHPALCAHPEPRDVAIVGGGDCGTLREVLRHEGVRSATQIEIDEAVTQAAREHFPELCEANDDARATLLFDDGVRWMADQDDASLDIVLIDSTDPVGPAEALFGEDFLTDVHRVLRPGGIVAQQSESPLYHTGLLVDLHASLRRIGFNAVETLPFPQPVYPSGWWSATLARKSGDFDNATREPPAGLRYFNRAIYQAARAQPEFLRAALADT